MQDMGINIWNRTSSKGAISEPLYGDDRNKMMARHIVLNGIEKPLDDKGISSTDPRHVHVVIVGTDALSLAVLRQVALIAHYPNFDDETGANRTRITVIDTKAKDKEALDKMQESIRQMTGHLLQECYIRHLMLTPGSVEEVGSNHRQDSFIDLEFEWVGTGIGKPLDYFQTLGDANALVSVFSTPETLDKAEAEYAQTHFLQHYPIDPERLSQSISGKGIDVRRARLINTIYNVGTYLKDICMSDIYNVKAYHLSLSTFVKHTPDKKVMKLWEEIAHSNELKLSNVYCGDCFDVKVRSVTGGKSLALQQIDSLIAEQIEPLSKSEHARWNVDKLILGFRPYTAQERYEDEFKFGADIKKSRSRMKKVHKAHIDICSCRELARIDPESIKYDCFLTLALAGIIGRSR